jgi:hypothetical protein
LRDPRSGAAPQRGKFIRSGEHARNVWILV